MATQGTTNQRADRALEAYVERQARENKGKDKANAQALSWKVDQRRRDKEARRQVRLQWWEHHKHLEGLHAALAEEHRQQADRLLPPQMVG